MMVTRVASHLTALKNIVRQPKRAVHGPAHGGGHGHHAPWGPLVTYDYMPVPSRPYGVVYNQLQRKFNAFLGFSVLFTIASAVVCIKTDAFGAQNFKKPESYYAQKKAQK